MIISDEDIIQRILNELNEMTYSEAKRTLEDALECLERYCRVSVPKRFMNEETRSLIGDYLEKLNEEEQEIIRKNKK